MNESWMKFDIVLQGECTPFTKTIIEEYRKLPFVENIILSTYENSHIPDDVNVIFNELVSPRGLGNRNLQINTSKNGLSLVQSKYCIKMRTDQLIRDMLLMYDYWKNDKREDGKVFVMGMYKAFPYHPRDHVFWGRTKDVVNVFDIPFDIERGSNQDYTYNTRAETYIGQYYYARFDPSVWEHINDPLTFLVDSAIRRNEALEKDYKIRDRVFVPFPRVSMSWPKHGLNEYHYHIGKAYTEYWAN